MGDGYYDDNTETGTDTGYISSGEGTPPVVPGTGYGTVDPEGAGPCGAGQTAPLDLNIFGASLDKGNPIAGYAQSQVSKVLDKAVYNNAAPAGSYEHG